MRVSETAIAIRNGTRSDTVQRAKRSLVGSLRSALLALVDIMEASSR